MSGIFVNQDKVRPGFYHRFTALPQQKTLGSALGAVALPLQMDWGKTGEWIELEPGDSQETFRKRTGYGREGTLLLREALKRASRIYAWRLDSGGVKAKKTLGALTATAACAGKRGNDIGVTVTAAGDAFLVCTTLAGAKVDEQTAAIVEQLKDNDYVAFSGTGALAANAGGLLAGGENGEAGAGDYTEFLEALDHVPINAFCLPYGDTDQEGAFAAKARSLADSQGKLVQVALAGHAGDDERVINVKNGVVLNDGTVLSPAQCTAWVAAATAAAGPASSLTYQAYDGAAAPRPRLSEEDTVAALRGGEFLFTPSTSAQGLPIAMVEQDINSLLTYTENRPMVWRKNRVVRALSYLVNSLERVWRLYYVGKVSNNKAGRELFRADLVSLMRELEAEGAFEDFDPRTDLAVEQGSERDAVAVSLTVQPVDAAEKMYLSVEVR